MIGLSTEAYATILASFVTFSSINKFLEYGIIPIPRRYHGKDEYKWRSAGTSLVHASIVGVTAATSLYPIWSDFVLNYTLIGEITIAIVIGYTIYDTVNLLRNAQSNLVTSLIAHHLIAGFFSVRVLQNRGWLGTALLCTCVELNSIFLHIQQLLLMYDAPKSSALFKVNNAVYILTFGIIRVPAFLLIMLFLVWDASRMTALWEAAMIPGTFSLLLVNVYLFKKVVFSDYLVK